MKRILDKGHVILDSYYGDDLKVVNRAICSTGQDKRTEFTAKEEKFIQRLMRDRHGVPFEGIDLTFHVKAPLSVAVEWLRHRLSSFSMLSLRYRKAKDEFYVPPRSFIRSQNGKAMDYERTAIIDADTQDNILYVIESTYRECMTAYDRLLELGVAKELARTVLPQGIYTEFYWQVNARSLMNFISLRSHHTAMAEIREYSQAIEPLFAKVAPATYAAFVKNGRVAP